MEIHQKNITSTRNKVMKGFYKLTILYISILFYILLGCGNNNKQVTKNKVVPKPPLQGTAHKRTDGLKVIHVFVALCDNTYQGIVPVPAKIGNGQDPANNLYWGCSYGIKSYFKNSKEWVLQKDDFAVSAPILERRVFKHVDHNTWMVADAYDGKYIKQCTQHFLGASCGNRFDSIQLGNGQKIMTAGSADLLAYVGHDGLMDFRLEEGYPANDSLKRETIVLACISKSYFAPILRQTNAIPILWSTGLMAPEAYVLHDALRAWVHNQPNETIRTNAAAAYSKYQKCSLKAARNLLVSGW